MSAAVTPAEGTFANLTGTVTVVPFSPSTESTATVNPFVEFVFVGVGTVVVFVGVGTEAIVVPR
ncbi:MAG: hypothetical protein BWY74_03458 [Firmicutes bacterium ADurb.Bin419]|nr:MAG: hypothetical protein BWY74_03458 [Firmicutes bacterium ADurb.Bin419]